MMTDPIADFLIRIQNGYLAKKNEIISPCSKIKYALAQLLQQEGLIGQLEKKAVSHKTVLRVGLVYENNQPKIKKIVRVSKPGRRVYAQKNKIPRTLGGLGRTILSTSKGLMTDKKARKEGFGGEVICKIW